MASTVGVRAARRFLAPIVLVFAVSCGGGSGQAPPSVSPLPPGPSEPGSPQPQVLTHLVIGQVIVGSYDRMTKSFVRVTGDGYRRVAYIPRAGTRLVDLQQPGSFTIRSWQAPCASSCKRTLKPIDGCTGSFAASGVPTRILITVTPGQHCRITIG